jgi:hypothetical protein
MNMNKYTRIQLVTNERAPFTERWATKSFSHRLSQEGFATMAALQRSYEFWSEKAKKHGFSPEEVVRMGRACHYVVVDQMTQLCCYL